MRRVVLLGASGVFGRRIAERLARWPGIELVLAGRRMKPLDALKTRLAAEGAAAALLVASLDAGDPATLVALAPWAVIDAAGPFQGARFGLARAVLEAGAHWIDIADARDHVAGFGAALDDLARSRGLTAITGASSTPAITQAALNRMTAGWRHVDVAWAAISPGAQTFGLSVAQAVLSQAGQPILVLSGGAWVQRPGWGGPRRVRIPGVGRRWVVIADAPDLDLLPRRASYEGLFFAGAEPGVLTWGVWLLGWLVRLRLAPTLRPLATPLRPLADLCIRFGAKRGGMVVAAEGVGADGERRIARWSLAATADAGPAVPGAPAVAVLRRLLAGGMTPGAGPCVGLASLDEIVAEVAGPLITTRLEAWAPDRPGLFPGVLGDDFDGLPPSVREVHAGGAVALAGVAVSAARGWAARIVGAVLGLPPPGRFEARVVVEVTQGGERWTRRFGPHRFASFIAPVTTELGLFEERLGPTRFRFSTLPDAVGFRWVLEGWSLGPIPLPRAIGPRVRARSFDRDGTYRFSVLVSHPWLGVLVAYAGRLRVNRP